MATIASHLKLVPTALHGGILAHRCAWVHATGGPEQCADGGTVGVSVMGMSVVGVSIRARHLRAGI